MTSRREFLAAAGGLALAGLAGPAWLAARPGAGRRVTVVRMASDPAGARVGFQPAGVHLAPGDRVRWVLEGGAHSTTAYHPDHGASRRIPAAAEPWDSGILFRPGDAFERVFEIPGVYDYFCRPHEAAGMVGRIVVGRPGVDFALPGWISAGPAGPGRPGPGAFPSVDSIVAGATH